MCLFFLFFFLFFSISDKLNLECAVSHYGNMPMQYIAIFHGCKNDNFQMKNCDVILIFAQYIGCGNTFASLPCLELYFETNLEKILVCLWNCRP